MAKDICFFLSRDALSRIKFPVKTDLISVPRNRSGSSAWSVEHKKKVCEGEGQVAKGRSRETLAPLVGVLSGVSWRLGSDPCADLLCQGHNLQGYLLWGGGEFLSSHTFCRNRAQTVWLVFHPFTDPQFFQGHENVLQQHRKTISHPAPPMRWKQSLIGSCCLLTLALGETILIGQKWTCFSDCSFSSLLALWDFLFMDKETAASPVSAQRNCNCANWATLS